MFKEMSNEEMMQVDGGHSAWNERPENIDSEREKRDAIIAITVGGIIMTGGSSCIVEAVKVTAGALIADRLLN